MKLDKEDKGRRQTQMTAQHLLHPPHQEVMRLDMALPPDGVGGINADMAIPHN